MIDCAQYAVCLAYLQQWIANPVARIRTAAQLPCSACRVRSAMRIIADQSAQATTLRFPCAHVCALSTAHCICRGITAVTDTCVVDLTAVLHIAALTRLRTESPIVAAALDCVESFQFGQFASCTSGTVSPLSNCIDPHALRPGPARLGSARLGYSGVMDAEHL